MKALVTGGGGFLGGSIVGELLKRGDEVVTIQRNDYLFIEKLGVEAIKGDLRIKDNVDKATKNCDIVFHTAAKAGVWGDYEAYYQTNVVGTQNVIQSCLKNNVGNLVYTSTPSVVFDGSDKNGVDESMPYANTFFNAYHKTKTEAEKMVLKANCDLLRTTALRPHLIWGARDKHLIPRIIKRAKTGRLSLVGNGLNRVDSCYIDNACLAHILVADELTSKAKCAGKAYFISNGEPIAMKELINKILYAARQRPVTKEISVEYAYKIANFLEWFHKTLRIKQEPIMTKFVAKQMSTSHWFDISAAKNDFNYRVDVSIDEGMERLAKFLRESDEQT